MKYLYKIRNIFFNTRCFKHSGTGYKDVNGNYDGVLFNIFRKLFVKTECENKQIELF